MKMRLPRFLSIAILVCNLVFAARALFESYHARLSQDDFCMLGSVLEYGYWGGQAHWYQTWQGRWSSTALITAFAYLGRETGTILPFMLVTYAFAVVTFYIAIRRALTSWLKRELSPSALLNLAVFSVYLLYFCTLNTAESWYWIAACSCYLWSILLAIHALLALSRARQSHWWVAYSAMLFALVTASAEVAGQMTILSFIGAFAWRAFRRQELPGREWVIPFIASIASFAVMAHSPGNSVRRSQIDYAAGPVHSLLKAAEDAWTIIMILVKFKKPWLLGAFVLGFGVSAIATEGSQASARPSAASKLVGLPVGAGLALLLSYFLVLPAAFSYGAAPADRAWIYQSFVLLGLSGCLGAVFGRTSLGEIRAARWVVVWVLPLAILGAAGYGYSLLLRRIQPIVEYTRAYDERYALLKKHKAEGRVEDVHVEPLPFMQEYHHAEIGKGGGWVNTCLERGLELPFKVKLTRDAINH